MAREPILDNTPANSRRRLCYLAPDVPIPSPRGSSVHVIELARSLGSLGYEVHVVCRRTSKQEPKSEKLDGFSVHRIYRFITRPVVGKEAVGRSGTENKQGLYGALYHLYLRTVFVAYASLVAARLMRRDKMKLILERETAFGAGALASIITRKPLILEIVGPRYSRLSVRRSRRILYYTESMLREWVDRKKCIQVSGGVNLSLFREDLNSREKIRKEFGFEKGTSVIGYIGTFQEWHGIDTLLRAIVDLTRMNVNIKALLVGPYFEKYKELATDLGLGGVCIFTGPIEYEKIGGYINACDIMVALYEPERNQLRRRYGIGSPLKILEYMACGKPVVSTNVKPIETIVQNDSSGYLLQPGDRKGLVMALATLSKDKSIFDLFAANGRQFVEERFSWASLANLIDSISLEESS